jgi:hypothetical protein
MIVGAHAILSSTAPEADRAFLRDVLRLGFVDVGGGWLVFGLPPAEVAVHPSERNSVHELYLMCDDIAALVADLQQRGMTCGPIRDQRWGRLTAITLPSGGTLSVYEPRHARPPAVAAAFGKTAAGRFDVQLDRQTLADAAADPSLARFSLAKTFHGDLDAHSRGEMLSAGSAATAGAYVAIERVEGTLHGRRGSFALQHAGTASPAGQQVLITVVPGSGGGELSGLSGAMTIAIDADGTHRYDLTYALASRP